MVSDISKKIGDHWSKKSQLQKQQKNMKLRWWQSPHINKYINSLICDKKINGVSKGIQIKLKELIGENDVPNRCISVGGGSGQKEG